MDIKVRYLSKLGHTKLIAEAIALGANTKAVSILEEEKLEGHTDVLFLGGAPYANIMDKKLRIYANNLTKDLVSKVVLFTTSNFSKRTVNSLKKMLKEKGITVVDEYFYASAFRISARVDAAKEFGKKYSL